MYLQRCVKGIAGGDGDTGITCEQAEAVVAAAQGIASNWLRKRGQTTPASVREQLTEKNLDDHLHDYDNLRCCTPFISLACGAVERNILLHRNIAYSAVTTALMFATQDWQKPGALFYLWVPTSHDAVVPVASVAEPVRDLNIYRRWSPYQLEGEITAKIHIAANQIEKVEWWDGKHSTSEPQAAWPNPDYIEPARVSNLRELF